MHARDAHARVATLTTPNGSVETPTFMPVGTVGTVKGLSMEEVAVTGAGVVLANTYHLWLRPGPEVVRNLGGLHKFTRWPGIMLTDSGGFQVFSLAKLRTIDDEGVTFRSHLDGTMLRLTPEESMRIQSLLGADIAMAFDECPPGDAARPEVERAMARTTAWAARCLAAPRDPNQALFGIVQGGVHTDLRLQHLETLREMPFDGFALGGLSVGEPWQEMHRVLDAVAHKMPENVPRYLMGVGTPRDLIAGSLAGIDMFDCVLPTRNARNGQALTWNGRANMKQLRNRDDKGPIDPECDGPCCTSGYSRGYLRHLFMAGEMLFGRVVTQHNLYFFGRLMARLRQAIRDGNARSWADSVLDRMNENDEVGPADED
ncbi:MAG: tRNA guanosine(34) transglycosylase Tgt [Deltaproteobacteria bacterium]|nr:tRNA guanosine(34) transglycosylase Tgt [Deltaproteobacteria bacterium]